MFLKDRLKKQRDVLWLMVTHGLGRIGLVIFTLSIFIALFAPFLGTIDPMKSGEFENILQAPSEEFWLGTDDMGRDVWSQVLYGSRISLTIGLIAAFFAIIVGSSIGLISGFYGGLLDEIIMRIVDFFMMLPFIPLMLVLATILGQSNANIIVVLVVLDWAWISRMVRSEVLSLRERPYVEASECLGAKPMSLMFVEMLPNIVPMLIANAILMTIGGIYAEAVLSFLGLGDPRFMSWGQMINGAMDSGVMASCMWWSLPPIICIVLLTIGFSFIGTAYGDVTTPGYKESKGVS